MEQATYPAFRDTKTLDQSLLAPDIAEVPSWLENIPPDLDDERYNAPASAAQDSHPSSVGNGNKAQGTKKGASKRKKLPAVNLNADNVILYEMTPKGFIEARDRISNFLAEKRLVYNQNGRLVKVVTLKEKTTFSFGSKKHANSFTFDAGSTIIVQLSEDDMYCLIRQYFVIAKLDARSGNYVEKDPPANLIKSLMVVRSDWPFPLLTVVANCPCLRADGSILDHEGYDEATGMYADWQGTAFPFVPSNPTKEDALEALKILEEPIKEFPFNECEEDSDNEKTLRLEQLNKAVALSVMLTIVSRTAYQNAPMTAIDAHVQGTGKSTLADLFGIIATGRKPACITVAKDDIEFEKGLFAFLMNGSPVCLFDNVDRPLNSAMLNIALTQSFVRARILGATKEGIVPTSSVYIATGNNMQIVGDLTRRTILCRLNRNEERPSQHQFENPNMLAVAMANRSNIVVAALTILRAYHLAGRPKPEGFPSFGSFNEWSDLVRGALIWLNFPDIIESQTRLEDEDPVKNAFASVLEAWFEAYDSNPQTVNNIFKDAQNGQSVRKDLYDNLLEALDNAVPHRGDLRPRHVGLWLEKQKGKYANGFKLVRLLHSKQGVLWRVNPPK